MIRLRLCMASAGPDRRIRLNIITYLLYIPVFENATPTGEQGQVLHRQFCIAEIH